MRQHWISFARRAASIKLICLLALAVSAGCGLTANASAAFKPVVLLWPDGAPGAHGTADKDRPALIVHLPAPEKSNGCAVVICPGGGYQHLAITYEGDDVAEWFNTFGVSAFVLRYRLAPDYHCPNQMLDVQRALRTVRARSLEWQVDPARVGVMGFSAGGHLASTAATHFDPGKQDSTDPIERQSCRPDFAILAYPVITMMGKYGHTGSRKNLLGEHPDHELERSMSNETQVRRDTPPTFMFHTSEDTVVPPQNSVLFYMALREHGVPAELHIYEKGRHGLGLGEKDPKLAFALRTWPELLHNWLKLRGLLGK